mgnify:CR=1 FL=1
MSEFNLSRRYRQLKASVKDRIQREGGTCSIPTVGCPRVFDFTLHYNDPWAFTIHHPIPRARGGAVEDLSNMLPAHRKCNTAWGDRMPETRWEAYESDFLDR